MHSCSKTRLEGNGPKEKDDDVVDVLCIVQLERKFVHINLQQVCLHLFLLIVTVVENERVLSCQLDERSRSTAVLDLQKKKEAAGRKDVTNLPATMQPYIVESYGGVDRVMKERRREGGREGGSMRCKAAMSERKKGREERELS